MNSMLLDPEFMNNFYKFNPELLSRNQNGTDPSALIKHTLDFVDDNQYDYPQNLNFVDDQDQFDYIETLDLVDPQNQIHDTTTSQEILQAPDFSDACLKFISDILLEEEDLNQTQSPASPQDLASLQATEKSLYDALGLAHPNPESPAHRPGSSSISPTSSNSPTADSISLSFNSQSSVSSLDDEISTKKSPSRRRKSRQRDRGHDQDHEVRGKNKVQATTNEDYVEMEEFDDVILLCNQHDKLKIDTNKTTRSRVSKSSTSRSKSDHHHQVDLMTLLNQCAQAVSSFDLRTANELLKQIRHHTSPYGDSTQRLAHHVANALEARLAGTGSTFSTNLVDIKISSSEFLRSYRSYVSAIPFKRMSYFLANNAIKDLVANHNATKIHIIDFGIFLGLQWPCLIQALSKRPNGPPSLRITGIDYPQQGFRPAERVEATGRRLSGYCKRFGVPFEYHGIAQKWETIQQSDLKIHNDELVIVNCMYRSGTLLDETVDQTKSPKDSFLQLVRQLKPDLFIHGIINGTFNAPFFVTRFKEALFHYSAIFDVFDATMPREAHGRLLIESEMYGKEVVNTIACEGAERVQRSESYKQWQVRSSRAGLRQVGLDQEAISKAKAMVKGNYHKDFVVDQDRHWMLQGWKGRIFCALSFWKPA